MDAVREGEGRMNRESSIETWMLPYVKQIASGDLLYDAGSSNSVLCDNLEGWEVERRFKREGAQVCLRPIHVMYGRNQHNIVKQLSSN